MALKPGQIKCINTLDQSLVVAAGAGSGKTFTLTKRIVHALESGFVRDVDQVLAITFTRKAAGELKSRVKTSLRAAGMIDQALKVDEAWISTIHGMCSRILRAHAVELGIDPLFAVADETTLGAYRDDAIERAVAEAREQRPSQIDALFGEYAAQSFVFGGASVADMVATLMDKAAGVSPQAAGCDGRSREGAAPGVFKIPETSPLDSLAALLSAAEEAEALAALAETQKEGDKRDAFILQASEAAAGARVAIDAGVSDASEILKLLSAFPGSCGFGTKEFKAQAKEPLARMSAAAVRVSLAAAEPFARELVRLATRAGELFAQAKRADGVLDNNDLLMMAVAAIRDNDDIAARYADKFKLIMVDEFQDTDQLQVDMIKRLAGPDTCRMCTVGDAQQSIYRFRGADVAVYRRHLASVERQNPDSVIKLPDNFRSHRDVLSFVDRIFERDAMFGSEFMSLGCSRDESQVKRPFMVDGSRIVVQHVSYSARGGTALMRKESARAIAARFAEYAGAGHRAGDMVLLLGSMTNAGLYAQAIRDAGLPCVISGGSVLKSTTEAAVVTSLVRWLGNPHRSQELMNLLTGPLFGASADDLVSLATVWNEDTGMFRGCDLDVGLERLGESSGERPTAVENGTQAAGQGDVSLSVEMLAAVRVLREASERIGRDPVAQIAWDAIVRSGWVSRLEAKGEEGQASAANVYKLVRILKDLEDSSFMGASSLADAFATTVAQAKQSPGALSAAGGNFVRIMTVHASKGLEFPIVAVAEMRGGAASTPKLMAEAVDGVVLVSLDLDKSAKDLGGIAKAGSSAIDAAVPEEADEDELASMAAQTNGALELRGCLRQREVRGEAEESKRLLYVALTRAKEALVVASFGNRTKENPNGAPKNVFASIGPALTGADDWFSPGISHFEFGGERTALVEHVALDGDSATGSGEERSDSAAGNAQPETFMVPTPERLRVDGRAYRPDRGGVFSYSGVSESSHKGSLLADLAAAFAVSADAPDDLVGDGYDASNGAIAGSWDGADDFWDVLPATADEDKATDFGTAFHLLAEAAVRGREPGAPLAKPANERIEAIARANGATTMTKLRLGDALDRWFGSSLARSVAKRETLLSEVPFFVELARENSHADEGAGAAGHARSDARAGAEAAESIYLEGEIDLLAFDGALPSEGGIGDAAGLGEAFVVDYKTGGSPDETADQLKEKHVLQASCYAYALLCRGFDAVTAAFVRVERESPANPAEPQTVAYHFAKADIAALQQAIARAYSYAREKGPR